MWLDREVAVKARTLLEECSACFKFLLADGFLPPVQSIQESNIFYKVVRIEYVHPSSRAVGVELAPASLRYDKDDCIIVSIVENHGDASSRMIALSKYLRGNDRSVREGFCLVRRQSDYRKAVRSILETYAKILETDLRGVLQGREWAKGYDVELS
jgi:hypothetical protein